MSLSEELELVKDTHTGKRKKKKIKRLKNRIKINHIFYYRSVPLDKREEDWFDG